MKKLMIVQPTSGRMASRIERDRMIAAHAAADALGEPLEILEAPGEPGAVYENELAYLAECLRSMQQADVVFFARGWTDMHLCRVLYGIAQAYDVLSLYG